MHLVIMGAGRVGVTLASDLESRGHSVAVIDSDSDAFRRLPPEFGGLRVTGVGFDRDVLAQAGIEDAYGFAAVSSGDNSNVLAARVVRETFGVENVVARIYDPRRAEVYERLGIPTVGTVRWATDRVVRRLLPLGPDREHTDASGRVALAGMDVHPSWVGTTLAEVGARSGCRAAYLERDGVGTVARDDQLLQSGDRLHVLAPTDRLTAVQRVLAEPAEVR